jgi:hypothetical protein
VLGAHGRQKALIVAEQRRVGRQVRLDEGAHRLAIRARGDEPMTDQHAAGMVVDREGEAAGGAAPGSPSWVPRAEVALQRDVQPQQAGLDPVARRSGDPPPAREHRTA